MENETNSDTIIIIYLRIQMNLQQMGHRSYQMAQRELLELLKNIYTFGVGEFVMKKIVTITACASSSSSLLGWTITT